MASPLDLPPTSPLLPGYALNPPPLAGPNGFRCCDDESFAPAPSPYGELLYGAFREDDRGGPGEPDAADEGRDRV